MGLAVFEDDPDPDHGEADELALAHAGPEALVAGQDELARDAAALDLVLELVGRLGSAARRSR